MSEFVKMFIIVPWRKILGEIVERTETRILVKRPFICDEIPSKDGNGAQVYFSLIGTQDEDVEFNMSQVIVTPFTPTKEYLHKYVEMTSGIIIPRPGSLV